MFVRDYALTYTQAHKRIMTFLLSLLEPSLPTASRENAFLLDMTGYASLIPPVQLIVFGTSCVHIQSVSQNQLSSLDFVPSVVLLEGCVCLGFQLVKHLPGFWLILLVLVYVGYPAHVNEKCARVCGHTLHPTPW